MLDSIHFKKTRQIDVTNTAKANKQSFEDGFQYKSYKLLAPTYNINLPIYSQCFRLVLKHFEIFSVFKRI